VKTFNRRGDYGETSLLFGKRVPKSDLRCEAYGTIDEANSALGLARSLTRKKRVQDILLSIQKDLFTVSAELATPTECCFGSARKRSVVTGEMVDSLEDMICELEEEVEMPRAFVIPGGSAASAAMDVSRAMIRRAERRAVELKDEHQVQNEEVLRYLNRLADLIFTLARYEENLPER
jgi:cob(I)alamin adenosyltransferase